MQRRTAEGLRGAKRAAKAAGGGWVMRRRARRQPTANGLRCVKRVAKGLCGRGGLQAAAKVVLRRPERGMQAAARGYAVAHNRGVTEAVTTGGD